ncbi:hypothetical protein K438DRAFT_1983501 [Mycena galopus ATCC 62051]|nr:hypothetical protein K438DRAFT_1983501 [Mycena galopus ATCC 62051]
MDQHATPQINPWYGALAFLGRALGTDVVSNNNTLTSNPSTPTTKPNVFGGTGRNGGKGGEKGGKGGLGGDRKSSWTINRVSKTSMHKLTFFKGGKGGDGGECNHTVQHYGIGGDGGVGQGPVFERALDYKLAPLADPPMAMELFCTTHSLKEDIKDLLVDQGFATAGDLYEITGTELEDAGFKPGHIAGLKKALSSAPKASC